MTMNEGRLEAVGEPTGNAPAFSPSVKKLIGSYERNLDSKSRIGLPQQYRDKLKDSSLILMRWLNNSLALFPEENWMPLAESINRLELYTKKGLPARHYMFAHSREVNMDKEGRIIIPQDMAEYAGLDGKIMLLGDWDKVTIWSNHEYRKQLEKDNVNFSDTFPEVLQLAKGQKSLESFEAEQSSKEES